VVLLEHVNLNLPRARSELARDVFLSKGLGFLEDPRPAAWGKADRLLWADAGLQQLHLPLVEEGNAEGDAAPQAVRGCVGVACASAADARAVRARLESLARQRPGVVAPPVDAAAAGEDDAGHDACVFTCPFGNRFVVYGLPEGRAPRFFGGADDARGHPPPAVADEGGAETIPRPVGIAWLRLDIPRGAARAVADFWGRTLGARVALDAAAGSVRVAVADGGDARGGQHLLFREADGVPAWDGHHVCVYVSDFEGAFRRAEARGVLYDPGRFADRGGTWALALEFQQFRTLHVPPEGAGGYAALGVAQRWPAAADADGSGAGGPPAPAYSLELEIRSMQHPSFPAASAGGGGAVAPGASPLR